jgi:hypothetical protein
VGSADSVALVVWAVVCDEVMVVSEAVVAVESRVSDVVVTVGMTVSESESLLDMLDDALSSVDLVINTPPSLLRVVTLASPSESVVLTASSSSLVEVGLGVGVGVGVGMGVRSVDAVLSLSVVSNATLSDDVEVEAVDDSSNVPSSVNDVAVGVGVAVKDDSACPPSVS